MKVLNSVRFETRNRQQASQKSINFSEINKPQIDKEKEKLRKICDLSTGIYLPGGGPCPGNPGTSTCPGEDTADLLFPFPTVYSVSFAPLTPHTSSLTSTILEHFPDIVNTDMIRDSMSHFQSKKTQVEIIQ